MIRGKAKEQPEVNNNLHVCNEPKVKLENVGKSLMDSSLSSEEIALVWDFYVSHAPIRKDEKEKRNDGGLRYLGEYGWKGSGLTALEREISRESNLGRIVVIKADELTQTLAEMNLEPEKEICCKHPRAVVQQLFSVKVRENGECCIDEKETRMVCFFRHIRNALAHNRIYYPSEGGMILLEDMNDNKKITARILIPTIALMNWIKIIDKNQKFYPRSSDANSENSLENIVAS